MGQANLDNPDTWAYPWFVEVKNRYSKRLVRVEYWSTEKEAKASAKGWRSPGGDYSVKVGNARPREPWET